MFVDLVTKTYKVSITNLPKGSDLWRVKCKNSKLYHTRGSDEGWYIYIIFNQGLEKEHKRY